MRRAPVAACLAASLAAASVAVSAPDPAKPAVPAADAAAVPRYDAEKVAFATRVLAETHPYRTDAPGLAPPIWVLDFLADVWPGLVFRVEVERRVLEDQPTATSPTESRTVGQALAEILAEQGCEYAVAPDGAVVVRRKAKAAGWLLDHRDGRIGNSDGRTSPK